MSCIGEKRCFWLLCVFAIALFFFMRHAETFSKKHDDTPPNNTHPFFAMGFGARRKPPAVHRANFERWLQVPPSPAFWSWRRTVAPFPRMLPENVPLRFNARIADTSNRLLSRQLIVNSAFYGRLNFLMARLEDALQRASMSAAEAVQAAIGVNAALAHDPLLFAHPALFAAFIEACVDEANGRSHDLESVLTTAIMADHSAALQRIITAVGAKATNFDFLKELLVKCVLYGAEACGFLLLASVKRHLMLQKNFEQLLQTLCDAGVDSKVVERLVRCYLEQQDPLLNLRTNALSFHRYAGRLFHVKIVLQALFVRFGASNAVLAGIANNFPFFFDARQKKAFLHANVNNRAIVAWRRRLMHALPSWIPWKSTVNLAAIFAMKTASDAPTAVLLPPPPQPGGSQSPVAGQSERCVSTSSCCNRIVDDLQCSGCEKSDSASSSDARLNKELFDGASPAALMQRLERHLSIRPSVSADVEHLLKTEFVLPIDEVIEAKAFLLAKFLLADGEYTKKQSMEALQDAVFMATTTGADVEVCERLLDAAPLVCIADALIAVFHARNFAVFRVLLFFGHANHLAAAEVARIFAFVLANKESRAYVEVLTGAIPWTVEKYGAVCDAVQKNAAAYRLFKELAVAPRLEEASFSGDGDFASFCVEKSASFEMVHEATKPIASFKHVLLAQTDEVSVLCDEQGAVLLFFDDHEFRFEDASKAAAFVATELKASAAADHLIIGFLVGRFLRKTPRSFALFVRSFAEVPWVDVAASIAPYFDANFQGNVQCFATHTGAIKISDHSKQLHVEAGHCAASRRILQKYLFGMQEEGCNEQSKSAFFRRFFSHFAPPSHAESQSSVPLPFQHFACGPEAAQLFGLFDEEGVLLFDVQPLDASEIKWLSSNDTLAAAEALRNDLYAANAYSKQRFDVLLKTEQSATARLNVLSLLQTDAIGAMSVLRVSASVKPHQSPSSLLVHFALRINGCDVVVLQGAVTHATVEDFFEEARVAVAPLAADLHAPTESLLLRAKKHALFGAQKPQESRTNFAESVHFLKAATGKWLQLPSKHALNDDLLLMAFDAQTFVDSSVRSLHESSSSPPPSFECVPQAPLRKSGVELCDASFSDANMQSFSLSSDFGANALLLAHCLVPVWRRLLRQRLQVADYVLVTYDAASHRWRFYEEFWRDSVALQAAFAAAGFEGEVSQTRHVAAHQRLLFLRTTHKTLFFLQDERRV